MNRRRSPRRKPLSFVKLKCRKGALGLGRNVALILLDISESGARLKVCEDLPLDYDVEVEFEAYSLKRKIRTFATVRWCLKLLDGNYCIGVAFQNPLPDGAWKNIALPG